MNKKIESVLIACMLSTTFIGMSQSYIVATFSGNGIGNIDGNSNISKDIARFNSPSGLTIDESGNIYVSDWGNNKIRKITPLGIVSTFAGSGVKGGLDGNGINATFSSPSGVVIDKLGNLYVSDWGNNKIRKISPLGEVTTLAGSGAQGSLDGIGYNASFNLPSGITIDAIGNLYVSEWGNNKIRKISPLGEVTTFAGSGIQGSLDGFGNNASFNSPSGIVIDSNGNLYVNDHYNHKIRKISPTGEVITFAGSGIQGSQDGIATNANFYRPNGITIDSNGNLYVSEWGNNKIRKIDPRGVVITFSGNGTSGNSDGSISVANFNRPFGLVTDKLGNIYVADQNNHSIRKISPSGLVTTYAGYNISGSMDGNAIAASFNMPVGIAIDALDNIYVADYYNHKIRKISPSGLVTTFAGSGVQGSLDGESTIASFFHPRSVSIDKSGFLYVADQYNNKIRKISPTGFVTTLAGSGQEGSVDGNANVASFSWPMGICLDENNNVYVADRTNNKIRKISPSGVVSTFAGTGVLGSNDGEGTVARFSYPLRLDIDMFGNIYVADFGNNKIRKISPTGIVSTLAGSGLEGSSDGEGFLASFFGPTGVAVDKLGNVFVTDRFNHRIRKVNPFGYVSTIAGSGMVGSKDGEALSSTFYDPSSLAIASDGSIFVTDQFNYKIRKISVSSLITESNDYFSYGNPDYLVIGDEGVVKILCDANEVFIYDLSGKINYQGKSSPQIPVSSGFKLVKVLFDNNVSTYRVYVK